MKKAAILIALALLLIIVFIIWSYYSNYGINGVSTEKNISGQILDCSTNLPISGAQIKLVQSGFGIDQAKLYTYNTESRENGDFAISWNVGNSAHILANKLGYQQAEQNEQPRGNIIIKLLKSTSSSQDKAPESTHYCKPVSECIQSQNQNGLTVYKDMCTHY